jgi:hypothetical protein
MASIRSGPPSTTVQPTDATEPLAIPGVYYAKICHLVDGQRHKRRPLPEPLLQSFQPRAGGLGNDNRETVAAIEVYLPACNGHTSFSFVLRRKP